MLVECLFFFDLRSLSVLEMLCHIFSPLRRQIFWLCRDPKGLCTIAYCRSVLKILACVVTLPLGMSNAFLSCYIYAHILLQFGLKLLQLAFTTIPAICCPFPS